MTQGRTRGWGGELSRFGEYLKRHAVQRETIATGADVTPSYISMLAHGKARPGFALALRIQRWTLANVKHPDGSVDDTGRTNAGQPAGFLCDDWEAAAPVAA